ncbi:hypothetical protein LEMLEM_LOCUS7872 [Lemmus lemmus]
MPEISRMTVHGMPFQPHLSRSMDPPTPSSPLTHIALCLLEVARLGSMPLFLESLNCWSQLSLECYVGSIAPSPSHPSQAPGPESCIGLDSKSQHARS